MELNEEKKVDVANLVAKMNRTFCSRKTRPIEYRLRQLEGIKRMIKEEENLCFECLYKDMGKPKFEARMVETDFISNELRGAIFNLKKWTKRQKVDKTIMTVFDDAFIQPEPYGVVLIIGTWNYPLLVCLSPLIGAIAAGNCAIIKPSELAPETAKLLEDILPKYIDPECYTVVNGGPEVTHELLEQKLDYIFFTGSREIGCIVYQTAAKQTIPCTLELGGKSPVYIDESAFNNMYALRRLLWAKMFNAGQTCVAPDYMLCPREVIEKLIEKIRNVLHQFYGDNPKDSPDLARIINHRHFDRLSKLLTATGKIVIGGEMDRGERYIAPTICAPVSADDPLMGEEIFGPILPIVPVSDLDEAINFINSLPKPLTLYAFSSNQNVIERLTNETSSGSICFNDAVVHLSIDSLPFGGVGSSGFGVYHGRFSFETFSHPKSVLVRSYNPVLEWVGSKRYPPYSMSNLTRLLRVIRKRNVPYLDQIRFLAILLLGAFLYHLVLLSLSSQSLAHLERP